MDWKYDKWLEFRELWESSDPQSRQIYLMRRQILHEYIRDADYFKLMMHSNKDAEKIYSSARIRIIFYTVMSAIMAFCISLSNAKLETAIFASLLVIFLIKIFSSILKKAFINLKNYNLSFHNQLHLQKREHLFSFLDSVDIDSILYVKGNKYLLDEKMKNDQDEEYKKCFLYYQNTHLEILKKSQISKEPNIFPL